MDPTAGTISRTVRVSVVRPNLKVSDKVGRATPEHGYATGFNPWFLTQLAGLAFFIRFGERSVASDLFGLF